jgi:uncharacterized membrane protein YraQ (UPF0718 family)
MRGLFGLVGLLLVVVIVGLLVRKTLAPAALPTAPGTESAAPANPAQQSRQIQDQFKQDLEKALQQPRLPADQ